MIIATILIISILGYIWYSEHINSEATHTTETQTRNVNSITTTIPLNPIQVTSINYIEFSSLIVNMSQNITIEYPNGTELTKAIHYGIRNDSTNDTICFYIYLDVKATIFDCTLFLDKTTNKSFLTADIYGSSRMSQKDIESEKGVLKTYIGDIISVSHLTLDWSKAEWTITYAD